MVRRYPVLVLLTTILCLSIGENDTDKFVPTKEWQVVKNGQSIPDGLHVRMNLETKTVEAKLLDDDDRKEKSLVVAKDLNEIVNTSESEKPDTNNIKIETVNSITRNMEEALKKLPTEKMEYSNKKMKTLEELRSEFSDLNMAIKTDLEIMSELFQRYETLVKDHPIKEKRKSDIADQFSVEYLDIFVDLEYLVHQYDNANEFIRLRGIEKIILPHLNGTENTLKAEALKILTACLQNNIKAQIYALETNIGEVLLKILSLDTNEYVKASAIRAISALVRGFPSAQKYITSKHGMDVFQNVLLSDNPNYFKFKILILTLLDDLVLEHKLVTEFQHSKPEYEEKIRQYQEVNLMSKLSNPYFCGILSKLLQEYFEYDNTDLNNIQKITSVMTTFMHSCKYYHFKDKKLLATFHKMQVTFTKTINKKKTTGSTDSQEIIEFYSEILEFIEKYMTVLNDVKLRDEL